MAGKIQKQDVKTLAELTGAGASASDLIQDTQIYVSASGLNKQLSAAIADGDIGGGGGGKNYIQNDGAEADTSGWSVYKDAAGPKPVDGTGQISAPTLTWTRTTSSPLSGVASFLATNSGANCQGEGISYDFTVDRSDEGSILTCPLAFQPRTGTYSGGTSTTDSDLTIYLVSREFGTVIQPSYYKLQGAVNNTAYKAVPVFQVPVSAGGANAREFRLCIHVATTNTAAWTVAFDEIGVTPIAQGIVPIVSDTQSYTPIWGAATTAPVLNDGTIEGFWTRIGDLCQVVIRMTSGASTTFGSGNYDFRLPHPADTSKMTGIKGRGIAWLNITGTNYTGTVELENSFDDRVYIRGTGTDFWAHNTPTTWANTSTIELSFMYPVKGWGSSVAVAPDDTSGRFISSRYDHTTGSTYSGGDIIDFNSKQWDDNAAVTTGASWRYTAKEPGQYEVTAQIESGSFSATAGDRWLLELFKNGSLFMSSGRTSCEVTASQIRGIQGQFTLRLNAGDYFDIRLGSATTFGPLVALSGYSYITVTKVEGRTQVGPGELIAARATTTTAGSYNAGDNIVWDSKSFDTHGAFDIATGKFTAPAPGKYKLKCQLRFQSASNTQGDLISLLAEKNDADYAFIDNYLWPFTGSSVTFLQGSTVLDMNSGDTCNVYAAGWASGTRTLSTNAGMNYIEIERIG